MSVWEGITTKVSDAAGVARDKAFEVSDAAQLAAQAAAANSASAAFARALDALDEAVGQIRMRRPTYEVTVQVTIGPVSLSVTVPVHEQA